MILLGEAWPAEEDVLFWGKRDLLTHTDYFITVAAHDMHFGVWKLVDDSVDRRRITEETKHPEIVVPLYGPKPQFRIRATPNYGFEKSFSRGTDESELPSASHFHER
ncbi:MAG TPA: hypothetical protein VEZ11_11005 [Thermoanaerobaculia bacterium]|nr:hypothetical protein [Thermoanaerobaculia bacterium]